MKLISMTTFVLEQKENTPYLYYSSNAFPFVKKVLKYAQFLKQPLELYMFVPCDEDGNVLEEPKCNWCFTGSPSDCHRSKECAIDETPFLKYRQAKDKVLFEGLSLEMGCIVIKHEKGWNQILGDYEIESNNIEYLLTKKNDYILTPTAIKQLGL